MTAESTDGPGIVPIFRSKTYDSITALYAILVNQATKVGDELVWAGHLVTLADAIKMSQAYVSRLLQTMETMRIVERQARGRRQQPSEYVILRAPDPQDFLDRGERQFTSRKAAVKLEEFSGSVNEMIELVQRVYKLERTVQILATDYARRFPDVGDSSPERAAEDRRLGDSEPVPEMPSADDGSAQDAAGVQPDSNGADPGVSE